MTWRTHAAIGANAGIIALHLFGDAGIGFAVALGAFGGLFPDIDAAYSRIHNFSVLGLFRGSGRSHRKFFHSLLIVLIFILISFLVFDETLAPLAFAFIFGYASHLLIDGFNYAGVMYFWPWKKKIRLVPKIFQSRVGSIADQGLFIIGCLILLLQILPRLSISF